MILGIIINTAMSGLLSLCAPHVGDRTMAGIIQYESAWKPWSIGDNTSRKSYSYNTQEEAIQQAEYLLYLGHDIDTGLSQINSTNFRAYGLTAKTVFEPCTNVRVGSDILKNNYIGASRKNWIGRPIITKSDLYTQQQYALVHALSAYNSGGYWASMKYAENVYTIAARVQNEFTQISTPNAEIRKIIAITPKIQKNTQKENNQKLSVTVNSNKPSAASIIISGTTANWSTKNHE